MQSLLGRTVAITGASRGMGRRFATALSDAGAQVILLARPSQALDEASEACGANALKIACDVADPASVNTAFAEIEARFGSLDVLVNNAGVSLLGKVEDLDDAAIRDEVGINLLGPIFTMRAAIPLLRRSGAGDIINVSSESVRLPFPYLGVYAATKAGLEMVSAAVRAELRSDLIRVTVLRAGFVSGSELARHWPAETTAEFYAKATETGHIGMAGKTGASPEAMAQALIHLLTLPREINVDLFEVRPTPG